MAKTSTKAANSPWTAIAEQWDSIAETHRAAGNIATAEMAEGKADRARELATETVEEAATGGNPLPQSSTASNTASTPATPKP